MATLHFPKKGVFHSTLLSMARIINRRPHLLFRHPRLYLEGKGDHSLGSVPPNGNSASQYRRTKSLGCFKSNHTRFYYITSHFDLHSAGQTEKCCFFVRPTFLQIILEPRKEKMKHHRIPLVETHRRVCILCQKGQFENVVFGQIN